MRGDIQEKERRANKRKKREGESDTREGVYTTGKGAKKREGSIREGADKRRARWTREKWDEVGVGTVDLLSLGRHRGPSPANLHAAVGLSHPP